MNSAFLFFSIILVNSSWYFILYIVVLQLKNKLRTISFLRNYYAILKHCPYYLSLMSWNEPLNPVTECIRIEMSVEFLSEIILVVFSKQ